MIQPKIFYFYRLNFLLYFLCKHYFMVFYIPKRLSVIFFLLKISCCIFKLFKKNRNLILNYRFGYRTKSVVNNAPLIKNIDVVKKFSLFKIRLLHSNNSTDVVLAGGGFFFNFYYYKFRYYSSVCSTLILEFMPKIKHLFKIQNYFFTKRKKRFNYFLYIWLFEGLYPRHLLESVRKRFRLKARRVKWQNNYNWIKFSYLFGLNKSIIDDYKIKESKFIFFPKTLRLFKKAKRKRGRFFFKKKNKFFFVRRKTKRIFKKLIRRRSLVMRYFFLRRRVYFKTRYLHRIRITHSLKQKSIFKIINIKKNAPKRVKWYNRPRFRWGFVNRRKKIKFFYVQKFLKVRYTQNLNLLEKAKFKPRIMIFKNYFFTRDVFVLISNIVNMRVFYSLSQRFPFFYSFRLLYMCLYHYGLVSRVFGLHKFYRVKFLFWYLKWHLVSGKKNSALLRCIGSSNVCYAYFLPYICRLYLREAYTGYRFAGFNWLFYNQMSLVFLKLFNSNFFFSLNFTYSESLGRSLIWAIFQYFLSFNPPKGNMHFIKELGNIYLLTGLTKDSNLLLSWIVRNLAITFYRKHWRFLIFLKATLEFIFARLQISNGVKGVYISFRGKIGQVGSVRKKALVLRQGITSFANIGLKLSFSSSVVCTKTGVIGVSVGVYY